MQRSNGQGLPPGGVSTRPPRQLSQPPPQGQQAPVSDQLSQFRQPGQGQPQPYAGQYDPYALPPTQPQAYVQQPTAPQPYTAPPMPPQSYEPQAYEPQPYAQAPSHQAYPPQAYAQPQSAAAPQPRGTIPAYDQWSAPVAAQDPRGYDLGGHQPQSYDQGYGQHGYANPAYAQPAIAPQQQADWGQHAGYAQPAHEASLDNSAYQQDHQQAAAHDAGGDYQTDDDGYEYEEAPSKGRFLRVAAALVGAIVVGGGLAYAYTSMIGTDSGSPPVIKSASGPTKTKPADPGGKKFANSDSKLMGRLNEGTETTTAGEASSGVKKVATVQISPDGSIVPPAETPAATPPAPAAAPAATAAAGIGSEFPDPGANLAQPVAAVAQAPAAPEMPVTINPPKAADKPVQVVTAAVKEVKPAVSATTTNSINAAAAAATAPAPLPPPAPKKTAAVAPTAAAAVAKAAAPVSSGAGYVAVVASVPVSTTSRINALKQFADMQQKYGTVLQNKMPDVREANLGEKGNYHRLLVGPPGSREGAQALCGSLKAAGYAESCWVTAY